MKSSLSPDQRLQVLFHSRGDLHFIPTSISAQTFTIKQISVLVQVRHLKSPDSNGTATLKIRVNFFHHRTKACIRNNINYIMYYFRYA